MEIVGEKLGTTPRLFRAGDAGQLLKSKNSDEVPGAPAAVEAGGEAGTRLSVYLGSSLSEFAEERDALAAALQSSNLPIQLWRFENVPASSSPPRSISRDAIERCDAVVVLLGQKLVRFTVDEIDVARALGKPVLVYAKDERSSWTA